MPCFVFEAPVEPLLPPDEEGFDVAIPIQPFTVSIHLCIWLGMFHLPCFALSIQEREIEGERPVKRDRFRTETLAINGLA